MSENAGEKKIIVDDDWKERVEAEREELTRQQEGSPGAGDGTSEVPQMPPASFEMLLTSLATEAMVALGQIPHPATGESIVRLDQAKYFIDTIEILESKCKGNLATEEEQALEGLLHQLRMAYVAMEQTSGSTPT